MSVIQWFPGHMVKARKEIEEKIKLVDIVLELVDARAPKSSLNPVFEKLLENKKKVILLTKSDLSDSEINDQWIKYFKDTPCLLIDSVHQHNAYQIPKLVRAMMQEKTEKNKQRGIVNKSIKMMIIGIPNVGKSTLINQLANKKRTKTENRPGVTRVQQWVRLYDGLDLLDTPGVLWPKFDEVIIGYNLALTGAIKDDIIYKDDMVLYFIDYMREHYRANFEQHYSLSMDLSNIEILDTIGKMRGLMHGGQCDYEKVYRVIINDFRSLKLGRISLEVPGE